MLVRGFAEAEKQRIAEQEQLITIVQTLVRVPSSPFMLVKLVLILAPILFKPLVEKKSTITASHSSREHRE